MRQILLFAALAASLALLSGCTLSKAKKDTSEDTTDKASYPVQGFYKSGQRYENTRLWL